MGVPPLLLDELFLQGTDSFQSPVYVFGGSFLLDSLHVSEKAQSFIHREAWNVNQTADVFSVSFESGCDLEFVESHWFRGFEDEGARLSQRRVGSGRQRATDCSLGQC